MPFRLRKDIRDWFKDIRETRKELSLDFDMYYFCLMAGLATGRKADVGDATDLVDDFPGPYREKGRVIVALFLSRELHAWGIARTERGALHTAIRGLVNPLAATHLSETGLKEINRYASGGYEALTEWFDDRPRTLETFLPMYKAFLDAHLPGSQRTDAPVI